MKASSKLEYGNFLFKHRGILPVPIIIFSLVYYFFSNSYEITQFQYLLSLSISISGLILRVYAVGYAFHKTSGKNTAKQIAESLNTSGIYSVLRNPLYLANFLNWLGIVLLLSDIILTVFITLFFIHIYYYIILVEENFLKEKFKKKYEEYLKLVPRIIPSLKNWKKPVTDFNFKKSLINIKNGLLGIAIVFNLINLIDNYKHSGKILEINWLSYFLLFSIFFYFSNKLILNFKS